MCSRQCGVLCSPNQPGSANPLVPAGTNGERIHYTHDRGSMLPVHADLIDRGKRPALAPSMANPEPLRFSCLAACAGAGVNGWTPPAAPAPQA